MWSVMSHWASALGSYWELGRIGFANILAYRLRYYMGVVTYFINVAVYYFIWRAIYEHSAEIQGFRLEQMLTYVAVGWMIRSFYFNNIDHDLAMDVMEGKITMDLIKPVDFQAMHIARAAGESFFRLFMLTLPAGLLIGLVFPVQGPASSTHFALFFLSVVLAFFIVASLNFTVGVCAVRLKSILGLLRAKYFLLELLSGLLLPISFFPEPFQRLFVWLPFQHISYSPLLIYLGKVNGAEIGRILGLQLAWIAVLVLIGQGWWRLSSRKITIHGG